MTISTSVWSGQHPNTGGNIQHLTYFVHAMQRLTKLFMWLFKNNYNKTIFLAYLKKHSKEIEGKLNHHFFQIQANT